MKFIEEHIKKRFQNAKTRKGVDTDGLWQDILADLPDEGKATGGFKRYLGIFLFGLPLLIGLVFFIVNFPFEEAGLSDANNPQAPSNELIADAETNQNPKDQASIIPTSVDDISSVEPTSLLPSRKADLPTRKASSGNEIEVKDNLSDQIASFTATTKTKALQDDQNEISPVQNPQTNNQITLKAESVSREQQDSNTKDLGFEQAISPTENRPIVLEKPNTEESKELIAFAKKEEKIGISQKEKDNTNSIILSPKKGQEKRLQKVNTPKKIKALESKIIQAQVLNPPVLEYPELIDPQHRYQRSLELNLSSGWNIQSNQYEDAKVESSLGQALSESQSLVFGNNYSMNVRIPIKDRFSLATGIGFQTTKNEFNTVQVWDTLVFRNNQPSAELLDATATRTVRHFNRQSFISVPLLLDYAHDRNTFGWGISSGINLNWMHRQSGRTLNNNQDIFTYPNTEVEVLPYQSFFVSAQIRPRLQYRINRQFALEGFTDFRYQWHGQSDLYSLNLRSLYVGCGLGLNYRIR